MRGEPTEAQVRSERIDVQLARAGWNVEGLDFEAEYEVGSAGEPDHGFSDYMLTGPDGLPIAIVEAKRSSRDAIAGKEQAHSYVEAIHAAHGRRPFVFLANGDETWFWDLRSNPRRVGSFFRREDLERRSFQLQHRLPLHEIPIDSDIIDRPYQQDAVRKTHAELEAGRRKALWLMATGTGKTRTTTALISSLLEAKWAQSVLFLVDRSALADQALEAFGTFLPNEPSDRIRTSNYDGTKRLYVATLQTMQDFYDQFSSGAFDLVVSDESHRSIYNKWESVVAYFDAYLLGLTATPADYVDRNTFAFFDRHDRVPTFAYELDEAIADGYLVPYEGYHARTTIQIQGIRGEELPAEVQERLIEEGIDPSDLDFAGTELEKKVTNDETTRLLVTEFFDACIKQPDSNLPGKSIIFAISHQHAKRLWEAFNNLYPQFPGLAEIVDSHMERPDLILRRFKTESMPRIAISVDMLDTGVDVPTIVNLGLMKPVFSRIKFWQMMGRGTRPVGPEVARPWCPAGSKDRYRVLDFWENLERFQLNPDGVEPSVATPAAVRYFRLLIKAHRLASAAGRPDLAAAYLEEAQTHVESLPLDSAGVRESRALVRQVQERAFWAVLDQTKQRVLTFEVAPLMRFLPDVRPEQYAFASSCIEFLLATLSDDAQRAGRVAERLRESVVRLPTAHPDVEPLAEVVVAAQAPTWANAQTIESVETLRNQLAALMHLRRPETAQIVRLDLSDAFQEKWWISVGTEGKEFDADEYRSRVEGQVRELATRHPAFKKLAAGDVLDDQDLAAIEATLNQPDLYVTEDTLRAAYRAPHGSLVTLLRHALGFAELPSREDAIRAAFEAYVAQHGYLNAEKLTFIRVFAQRLIQKGRVDPGDLFREPFTRISTSDTHRPSGDEINDLFALAAQFEEG